MSTGKGRGARRGAAAAAKLATPQPEQSNVNLLVREQEGFAHALSVPPDQVLQCGTVFDGWMTRLSDFRGPLPDEQGRVPAASPGYRDCQLVEWESSPAQSAADTVFTWIGGSEVRPVRPAFPYATAMLSVDGAPRLRFPLGVTRRFNVAVDGWALDFEPRRFQSSIEWQPHRSITPHGVSGFYRLSAPGRALASGRPLRLRVELDPPPRGCHTFFYVSSRTDSLQFDLKIVRNELAQAQADLVQLRVAQEMLYAQLYPQLFPALIRGERFMVCQHETFHYHPTNLTVLRNGDAIVTAREGTDHISPDGRMVLSHSSDGGRTWSPVRTLFDLGNADHRSSPIFELPNGDWLATDYRAGAEYDALGRWNGVQATGPTCWGAWSPDAGRTWHFSEKPLAVPGAHPYVEVERHMIRLDSGRLLVPGIYHKFAPNGVDPETCRHWNAIFCSDDNGRSWSHMANLPDHPFVVGEATLVRTPVGRIVLLARTQPRDGTDYTQRGALFQTVSMDEGQTWTPWVSSGMSSMGSPGHLLALQDGRLLCSHASRYYPGSIYVTLSDDGGQTWNTARTRIVTNDLKGWDTCYPTSGQLPDGTLLTVWYANLFGKFFIAGLRYRPEEL